MERQVIFRDYQEQTAADHTNLQTFARASFDDLVKDAVSSQRRYAGLTVSKTNQVEITIAPGRVYDSGAVYGRNTPLVQSMASYTAAAARRLVAISAYGVETEVDVTTRDFLIDTDTGETEPRAVALTKSRDALLTFTPGADAVDPVPPPIPVTHVLVALVLMDTTQVVSVTMAEDSRVASTDALDERTDDLEEFRGQIEPQVSSLASDLASLANELRSRGNMNQVQQLFRDMARVKEILEIPDTAADYGSDRFLTTDETDATNSANLGYNAKVEEGIRFAHANEDVEEITLFSANDPNASLVNGLLLPKYDDVLKLSTGEYASDVGMAQYGFQTFNMKQMMMSRQRTRYGSPFTVCTNANWWQQGHYDPATHIFRRAGETFEVVDINRDGPNHAWMRLRQIFIDTYQDPYWKLVMTPHTIVGAQVAQSFLVSNDQWATKLGFHIQAKGGNDAISVSLCEVTNGVPDRDKVVLQQVYPHTSIVTGMNYINITPTFLKGGKRYALLLTSNANHRIGMTNGNNYLNGTFFYSTDGAYYQGDLTKDLRMEIWGAKFRAPQVVIEFQALNLDGGIRGIDILAGTVAPKSTDLIYEVQPNGSGQWIPLNEANLTAFDLTPPLVRFRARFVGTADVQPGIQLTGSTVRVFRPKTTFRHVSTVRTLATSTSTIKVRLLLEDFDDTPHDLTMVLNIGGVTETADAVTTRLMNATDKRYEREFTFNIAAPATEFRTVIDGTTNSAGNTFHVSELVYWI